MKKNGYMPEDPELNEFYTLNKVLKQEYEHHLYHNTSFSSPLSTTPVSSYGPQDPYSFLPPMH